MTKDDSGPGGGFRADGGSTAVQNRYRSLLDAIDDGIVSLDADGTVVAANDAVLDATGGARDDVLGSHVSVLFDEGDGAKLERELDRLRSAPEARGNVLDVTVETATGAHVRWELRPSTVLEDGDVSGFVCVARDVTDARADEHGVQWYEAIVEAVEDAVYVVDEDARFTMVNDAYVEMTGYDREEVLGEDVSVVVSEDVAAKAREREAEIEHETDADPVLVAEFETKDGERMTTEVSFALLPGDDERFHRVGVVRDVTERVERERELRTYKQIVETIDEGIYVKDADGYFTMVNDAYEQLTGYGRDELVGAHASLVVDEDVIQESRGVLDSKSEGGSSMDSVEAFVQTADDDLVPAEGSFSTLETRDGEEVEIGVVRDITERKEQRRRIEESERRYRTLVENFPEGAVGLFDEEFRYTAVGGELMKETGTSPEDRIGESVYDLYPEEIIAEVEQYFEAALAGEKRSFEVKYYGRDLLCHTLPVGGDDEVFAGMLVVQDISERRERERDLEAERERLEAVNNLHQVALEVNQALARQRSRDEIETVVCEHLAATDSYTFGWVGTLESDGERGGGPNRVVPSSATDDSMELDAFTVDLDADVAVMGPDARAMATNEVQVSTDAKNAPADGFWRSHADELDVTAVASVPVAFEDRPFGVLNVYTSREDAFDDVERRVLGQLGEIMGLAMAAAERADALAHERERFELLNRLIRHNLLNSLNVVGARLELLEGHVDDAVVPHLETVQDRTAEMTGLVETIRHLMQAIGDDDHDLEPVSLGSVLAGQVERARASHPEAEFDVVGEIGELGPVMADELLGEVLENVLTNAVQHNDSAEPRVRVSVSSDGDETMVRVADDGPGIQESMRERLFEKGEMGFDSPGSGFGLYLVREIVHAYGGTVEIGDSDLGGAVFEITLPTPSGLT